MRAVKKQGGAFAVYALLFGLILTSAPCFASEKLIYGLHAGGTSSGHAFWGAVEDGLKEATGYYDGYDYVWRGVPEAACEEQMKLLSWAMAHDAVGVVVSPICEAQCAQVREVVEQGVPVAFIDRSMCSPEDTITTIRTNNDHAGEIAGQELAKALGVAKGKRVLVLQMSGVVPTTLSREEGAMRALKAAGVKVTYVPSKGAEITDMRSLIDEALVRGVYDGIFTSNEPLTIATLSELKRLGISGEMVHVGFDDNPDIRKAIKEGIMVGTIIQNPKMMGVKSVEAVVDYLEGRPVEKEIETPVHFIHAGNIDVH